MFRLPPDRPPAHLALGEAYMQVNKNDWQVNDQVAVGRNLSLAIVANRRTLALDPEHGDARFVLEQLQRRLKDLQTP
jgi:hypothetical protein